MEPDSVVLIDTSSWIEALRAQGREDIRERVRLLLLDGRAAWCDIVAVELWNGARGNYEKKKLAQLEKEITCLETVKEVWELARDLARKCHKSGQTVPCADIIITACALSYKVPVEHCDAHISLILQIGS